MLELIKSEKPARAGSAGNVGHGCPSGKSAGAGTGIESQQPAGVAAGPGAPSGVHPSAAPSRPRLRSTLSVEHAAIAMNLTARQLELVTRLGMGMSLLAIARDMGIGLETVRTHVRILKGRTAMNRIQLAVLGYRLSGQDGGI